MLVVIEGLDGSGKSTQVRMLRERLCAEFPGKVSYMHFPRYDAPVYGQLITRFLRGEFGRVDEVHPQLVALLFAEDRHRALADLAPLARDPHGVLLLDRYVRSNIAYQCAKLASPEERERLRAWILQTEYGDFGLPRPDVDIFLDVPMAFVEATLSSARSGDSGREYLSAGREAQSPSGAAQGVSAAMQGDIHEASLAFQRAVRQVYLEETARDPRFVRLDCATPAHTDQMLPPAEIAQKLWETCIAPRIKP